MSKQCKSCIYLQPLYFGGICNAGEQIRNRDCVKYEQKEEVKE